MLGRVIGRTAVVFGLTTAWTEEDRLNTAAADVTSRQGLLGRLLAGALLPLAK